MIIKLLQLFITFAKIGLFGFGGGLAILPLIYQGISRFGMMTQSEFVKVVAISQATPGPIAVNAATYVGLRFAGFAGATIATFGVALPSFILIIIIMRFLDKYKESKGLQAVFEGVRPATAGLLAAAMVFVSEGALFAEGTHSPQLFPVIVFLVTIIAAGKTKISPILLIIAAGAAGAVICA